MELAPYSLEERGSSPDELLSYLVPNGYSFYTLLSRRRFAIDHKRVATNGAG